MASTSELGIIRAHNTRLPAIMLGAILCLLVCLIVWATWNGAAVQAALQQARRAEVADESRAICERWGMPAGSPKYAECLADLNSVRQRAEERLTQDMGIL
jgi:hypothetical protein